MTNGLGFDLIIELKKENKTVEEIILEFKKRELDPVNCFRLLRMFYKGQDTDIQQKIIRIYDLKENELDFNNPFIDDFIGGNS